MRPAGTRIWRAGRLSLLWRPRSLLVCLCLILVILAFGLLLLGSGTVRLSPAEILAGLAGEADSQTTNRLIGRIRLPRLLTAMLVGAALGMAGAVFQSISRNALGSPDVIGFTTGAASGAITAILLFGAGPWQLAAAAVGAGLATAAAVLLLAARAGGSGTAGGYRLILIGIGIGALLSGLNTLLMARAEIERAMSAQIWLAGSLAARDYSHVLTALIGLCLFMPPILLQARRLRLMEMGEDLARQLGVRVGQSRMVLVLAAVGLTSIATACVGPIAFIALAGPQVARRLTGSPEVPLVSGALSGTALMLAADLVSQNAPFNLTLPIGLTTGFLGGLYLVLLVLAEPRRGK